MNGTTPQLAHALATSPWWIYDLLILGLAMHIGGGSVAILSGYGAIFVRKGERLHRLCGKVFVGAMLTMASAAFIMAVYLGEKTNIAAGTFAGYLTLTAWLTVKRDEGRIGLFEKIAVFAIIGTAITFLTWGLQAQASLKGRLDGFPSGFYLAFAGMAGFIAALDLKVIWQGGVSGVNRIARHLWRMSLAFFVAAGSFFLGQQKIMPREWHGSTILYVLGFAPIVFLIFWLIRVRVGNRFKDGGGPAPIPAE